MQLANFLPANRLASSFPGRAAVALNLGWGDLKRRIPLATLIVLICVLSAATAPPTQAQDRWLDLPAPTGVTAANGENPGEAVVSWQPVAGAAFYRIAWIAAADAAAVAENGGGWLSAITFTTVSAAAGAGTQQHTLTRLNPGARYIFQVGSLRDRQSAPSWSLPAELNLTVGVLQPDSIREITVPVGLTVNEPGAFGGYTLWASREHNSIQLIDGSGQLVHHWNRALRHSRLLENGNLMGTSGGWIHLFDASNQRLWRYKPEHAQHHDFLPLPNGNVLILGRDVKTRAEAIAAGANPEFVPASGLGSDVIIEVRPIYPDAGEVVWQWSVWDHLVQDYDPTKANYGRVADHPELIDLNYNLRNLEARRWLHHNSLDYHPELDQILLSARNMSEIWVIDHSTTTEQAAGHRGGNSGQGGDLLYRWGNPQAYRAGTFADQQLFWQHHPYWIPEGLPGAGNILIFNNGAEYAGRALGYSSVVEITPPVSGYGYDRDEGAGSRYGPAQPTWTYTAENPGDFYASRMSNAQRLPNGNTMVVNGMRGTIFEVTPTGKTVWQYVSPVVNDGPMYQGDPMAIEIMPTPAELLQWWGNNLYRAYRYAPDYPGLQHYDLTPQGTVERYRNGGG